MSKFGWYGVADPPSALKQLHFHDGVAKLTPVDWEPKVAVLDQEDLIAQGIDTSILIPGARKVDALGSCVANTLTEGLSNILPAAEFLKITGCASMTDTVTAEKFTIVNYHGITDQTGNPSSEWPPTDCGSSGAYAVEYAVAKKWVSGALIAHGADNIVSLMQSGAAMLGTPWLEAWMNPPSNGFIDGNGSAATLQAQIAGGVAGDHEITLSAIEKLKLHVTGHVDPANTILRIRNHWTKGWCDSGSCRVHLSTLVALGGQVDVRQMTAA